MSVIRLSPEQLCRQLEPYISRLEESLSANLGQGNEKKQIAIAQKITKMLERQGDPIEHWSLDAQQLVERFGAAVDKLDALLGRSWPYPLEMISDRSEPIDTPGEIVKRREATLHKEREALKEKRSVIEAVEKLLKKVDEGEDLYPLLSKLPKTVRGEIYKLHQKRMKKSQDKKLNEEAKKEKFGKRSFKNQDAKCRVPFKQRLKTLKKYKEKTEKGILSLRKRIEQKEKSFACVDGAAELWFRIDEDDALTDEGKSVVRRGVIDRFVGKILSLKKLEFTPLPRSKFEFSLIYPEASTTRHPSARFTFSLKTLQTYGELYPRGKSYFTQLFDLIDRNGGDPFAFQELDPSIRKKIASFLSYKDRAALSSTCKAFQKEFPVSLRDLITDWRDSSIELVKSYLSTGREATRDEILLAMWVRIPSGVIRLLLEKSPTTLSTRLEESVRLNVTTSILGGSSGVVIRIPQGVLVRHLLLFNAIAHNHSKEVLEELYCPNPYVWSFLDFAILGGGNLQTIEFLLEKGVRAGECTQAFAYLCLKENVRKEIQPYLDQAGASIDIEAAYDLRGVIRWGSKCTHYDELPAVGMGFLPCKVGSRKRGRAARRSASQSVCEHAGLGYNRIGIIGTRGKAHRKDTRACLGGTVFGPHNL